MGIFASRPFVIRDLTLHCGGGGRRTLPRRRAAVGSVSEAMFETPPGIPAAPRLTTRKNHVPLGYVAAAVNWRSPTTTLLDVAKFASLETSIRYPVSGPPPSGGCHERATSLPAA